MNPIEFEESNRTEPNQTNNQTPNRWTFFDFQVVKIDGRVIGDGQVGPVTKRIQNAYKKLTEDSGVLIPTYHDTKKWTSFPNKVLFPCYKYLNESIFSHLVTMRDFLNLLVNNECSSECHESTVRLISFTPRAMVRRIILTRPDYLFFKIQNHLMLVSVTKFKACGRLDHCWLILQ